MNEVANDPEQFAPKIEAGLRSDTGIERDHNEDNIYVAKTPGVHTWAVLDGIGGHAKGEVASQIVVDQLNRGERVVGQARGDAQYLRTQLSEANRLVIEYNAKEGKDSGSTAVAVKLRVNESGQHLATFANIGDSRGYVFTPDARFGKRFYEKGQPTELSQVTQDHSLGEYKRRAGVIGTVELNKSENAPIVHSIGARKDAQIDTTEVKVKPGDILLLCSDGLEAGGVSNEKINQALKLVSEGKKNAQEMTDFLVQEANNGGGPDNISVVIIKVPDAAPSLSPSKKESGSRSEPSKDLIINEKQKVELTEATLFESRPSQVGEQVAPTEYSDKLGELSFYQERIGIDRKLQTYTLARISRMHESLVKAGIIKADEEVPDVLARQVVYLAVGMEISFSHTTDIDQRQQTRIQATETFLSIADTERRSRQVKTRLSYKLDKSVVGKVLEGIGMKDWVLKRMFKLPFQKVELDKIERAIIKNAGKNLDEHVGANRDRRILIMNLGKELGLW